MKDLNLEKIHKNDGASYVFQYFFPFFQQDCLLQIICNNVLLRKIIVTLARSKNKQKRKKKKESKKKRASLA